MPRVDIKVNKKYDDKGRLVQFDSSYSYYYSAPGGIQQMQPDSFYSRFRALVRVRTEDLFEQRFDPVFFNDSLYKNDLLNKDYFGERFELNKPMFYDFRREMDSLKTDILRRNYPQGTMKRKNY